MKKQVVILAFTILLIVNSCKILKPSNNNGFETTRSVWITETEITSTENGVPLTFEWDEVIDANSYTLWVLDKMGNIIKSWDNINVTSKTINLDLPIGTVIKVGVSVNFDTESSPKTYSKEFIIHNGGGTVEIVPLRKKGNSRITFSNDRHLDDTTFFKFPSEIMDCGSSIAIDKSLACLHYKKTDLSDIIKSNPSKYPDECSIIQDLNNILEACPKYIKYDY